MTARIAVYRKEEMVMDMPLEEGTVRIGRRPDNHIIIDHPSVSRYHAELEHRPSGQYVLRDLGSRNGTWVNGEPLGETSRLLANGDTITLSTDDVHMIFYDETATRPIPIRKPGISINHKGREVFVGGQLIKPPLTQNQYRLLLLLSQKVGEVCTRDEIIQAVWPEARGGVTDEAVDALVKRLRQRFAELDQDTQFIVTVPRHGFRLV